MNTFLLGVGGGPTRAKSRVDVGLSSMRLTVIFLKMHTNTPVSAGSLMNKLSGIIFWGLRDTYKTLLKILASICWDFVTWNDVLDRPTDWFYFFSPSKNNTMKNWMPYFFILFPLSCLLRQFNSDDFPTYIVIFWQSPRKNYIFLCLSGSCLLFSMCKGKKWVGVPPRCVCGSEAWWHGWIGNGLGSFGRKREGERGGDTDAPQVFAIKPVPFITTARPWHFFLNICFQ